MHKIPSDAEIDARARTWARDHAVGYSEALTAVCETFHGARAAFAEAPQAPAELSAADLDARARAYVFHRRVSYDEALRAVIDEASGRQARFSEVPGQALTDAQLDARARMYANEHAVSYADALAAVCVIFESEQAEFSCGHGGGGRTCFRDCGADVLFSEAAQMIEGQWIEIFKAGRHTSDSGHPFAFSTEDVSDIAAGYSAARHEAPLVIGHPETDAPAQGWVSTLQATPDGRLLARAHQVDSDFADSIKNCRYKKRSASFYAPNNPSNPNPGKWSLRHVGFLGAKPPAVGGMADLVL